MKKVTLNQDMLSMLNGTDREVELVDETGRTCGFFVPPKDHERLKRAVEIEQRRLDTWGLTQISEEEIERAKKSQRVYSTEEVIKRLESL